MTALVWCPFPDEASAAEVAGRLLDEQLIACANLLGSIRSIYEWNGARADERECGVLFKTHADRLEETVSRIAELHPYETPAVLGWRCEAAGPATAEWLAGLASPN